MERRRGIAAGSALIAALTVAGIAGRLRRYAIAEESMSPTLRDGDWVLARRSRRPPSRGAIVVFPHPSGSGMEIVKRVIGLPGERVAIDNGQVHIDGSTLAEPWADGPTRPEGTWELGPGKVFVLGDARSRSVADSRSFGPVDVAAIRWHVAARYRPLRAAGRL